MDGCTQITDAGLAHLTGIRTLYTLMPLMPVPRA
jgi:hypothetical protein